MNSTNVPPDRAASLQGERFDAAVTMLETLQRFGYYLHDAKGRCLDRDAFIAAITDALNAMQQPVSVSRSAQGSEQDDLAWRLGCMADAVLSAKVGPQARFFTRERVDEIVLLLREAEKRVLEGR
jgi:hypothetical protein